MYAGVTRVAPREKTGDGTVVSDSRQQEITRDLPVSKSTDCYTILFDYLALWLAQKQLHFAT